MIPPPCKIHNTETTVSQRPFSSVHRTVVPSRKCLVLQMISVMHAAVSGYSFSQTWCVRGLILSNRGPVLLCGKWNQGVHVTMNLCQVRWCDDRVACAQFWSQRAQSTHRLCSLLTRQPYTNHLAFLNLTFLYSKMYTVGVHMFMVVMVKVLSLESYRIHVWGPRRYWVVGWCDLQVYYLSKGKNDCGWASISCIQLVQLVLIL